MLSAFLTLQCISSTSITSRLTNLRYLDLPLPLKSSSRVHESSIFRNLAVWEIYEFPQLLDPKTTPKSPLASFWRHFGLSLASLWPPRVALERASCSQSLPRPTSDDSRIPFWRTRGASRCHRDPIFSDSASVMSPEAGLPLSYILYTYPPPCLHSGRACSLLKPSHPSFIQSK